MTSWCRSCDREFSAPLHRERHWRDSPRHHYCHVCKKHFGDESKLEGHALSVHPDSFCEKCVLIFQDEDDLHDHRWRSAEHPYYCDECRLDFSSASAHRQHMMSSAHQEKNHHCGLGVCPESSISQAAVVLHWDFNTTHIGKAFVCPNQDCIPVAKFSSLGGTLQHIASDACGGAINKWIESKVTKTMKLIRKSYNMV